MNHNFLFFSRLLLSWSRLLLREGQIKAWKLLLTILGRFGYWGPWKWWFKNLSFLHLQIIFYFIASFFWQSYRSIFLRSGSETTKSPQIWFKLSSYQTTPTASNINIVNAHISQVSRFAQLRIIVLTMLKALKVTSLLIGILFLQFLCFVTAFDLSETVAVRGSGVMRGSES